MSTGKNFAAEARDYLTRLQDVLTKVDEREIAAIAEVLQKAYEQKKTIFIMGNGGSGATASHIACDMNKVACFKAEKKFRFHSLCDSMPTILALGNDASFESIFAYQLQVYAEAGDVVIAISSSGNSPNIIQAVEYAKGIGCVTVGLCGFGGGKLVSTVEHAFHVKVNDMQLVEDVHLVLGHLLMQVLAVDGRGC